MTARVVAFPPAPLPRRAWLFLLAIAALALAGGLLLPRDEALPAPVWLLTPFFVALLLLAPLLALRRRRITIEGDELVVAAALYTRRVRVDALDLEHARVVDLGEHTALKPVLGLNRFGVPGFHAGHYLLRNRQRAFCLLTARDRVLVLPQRDGKLLLLSPDRPRDLLAHLRELAATQPRR
ncbi:hypothetical protein FZO89_03905 [Luteimonas viscosa]|uniref:PH domain-containing protein n=1 Tax=Luteimonas viscosa TaxID=1132694 RepID=A0A5D4XNE2_9GAMM|nr:hypothetical protein [Luteimonas viscosa]TYT25475.1 hypothetical protein FZO89_03905 [Luteimonas viscosa]